MRVLLILTISFLLFHTDAIGQRGILQQPSRASGPGGAAEEEQNETMLDSLKKMRIKREEDEHKKLVGKGEMIKENALALVKNYAPSFDKSKQRDFDKRLKDIDKAARSIRTDSGGYNDTTLDSAPGSTEDALKQLASASDRLNENLAKTNRRVVSVSVLKDTNEIIQLVKFLRTQLQ